MRSKNIFTLKIIAEALGDMLKNVVFVGGSTTELYVDSPAAPEPRPTQDVDCIVEVATYLEYGSVEKLLRSKGFKNDTSEGSPLCRWIYRDIVVDIMPIDKTILGFSNEWYPSAISHSVSYIIDESVTIKILSVPYFFATKLSALKSRGIVDLRTSQDFEDIVFVLNNRSSVIIDLRSGSEEIIRYIRNAFSNLFLESIFEEAISSVLDFGEPLGTKEKIVKIIKTIIDIK